MRFITFGKPGGMPGDLVAGFEIDGLAVDAAAAARALGLPAPGGSVRAILEGGAAALAAARALGDVAAASIAETRFASAPPPDWTAPLAEVRLAPPIPDPRKIICIGQNYKDHCAEQNVPIPKFPIIFTKFDTTLAGPRDAVALPPSDVTFFVDYEVELAFVIGTRASRVARDRAMDHVAGYMVMNDITARDAQKQDGQWVRAKSMDGFGPCGPALVSRDEIADPSNLGIRLRLNGAVMQDSSTSNLIFDVSYLIEYLTRSITLMPGDIISTGTPPGVGAFRKPPVCLKAGDVVEAEIDGLGRLENRITTA